MRNSSPLQRSIARARRAVMHARLSVARNSSFTEAFYALSLLLSASHGATEHDQSLRTGCIPSPGQAPLRRGAVQADPFCVLLSVPNALILSRHRQGRHTSSVWTGDSKVFFTRNGRGHIWRQASRPEYHARTRAVRGHAQRARVMPCHPIRPEPRPLSTHVSHETSFF